MNGEIILKGKYKIIKEIGSGAFGKVYLAEDITENSKRLAIKRITKQKIGESEYLKQALFKELEIMKICLCENSIHFIEDFESTSNHNIVMELCDSDLENILFRRQKGFSEEELKIILLQLKNVFSIMDEKNIIHRDLKLKNIMITYINKNEEAEKKLSPLNFIVKLADFGFSKVLDDDITSTRLGTPATMAPEIMMNKKYCKKADLWSLGIIMYQLLYKKLPFYAKNEQELLKLILESKSNFIIPEKYTMSKLLDSLLRNLLQIDIEKRYSWKEFYLDEFFANNNSNNSSSNTNDPNSVSNVNANNKLANLINMDFSKLSIKPKLKSVINIINIVKYKII